MIHNSGINYGFISIPYFALKAFKKDGSAGLL